MDSRSRPDPASALAMAEADAGGDESALVARARAGDTRAFEALVLRHQDAAYRLALRMLGTPEEAEEAAQDALVRAWRALPAFRGEAAFGTWLHRIVVRAALDRREAMRNRRRREVGVEELPDVAAAATDAAALDRDPTDALGPLLEALSDKQREAVALYYLEDRPVLEIAERMGCPENTVKTHLSRARAALRTAWLRQRP